MKDLRKVGILFFLLSIICAAFFQTTGCGTCVSGTAIASTPAAPGASGSKKTFTYEELSKFDGKEGRKAYVAVDGIVYDVSANRHWKGGVHTQCQKSASGRDLTEMLKVSPPTMRKLIKLQPVVGTVK